MAMVAPIEDLARSLQEWQDTMLSLKKEYEQESEGSENRLSGYRDIGKFQCILIGKAKSKKTFNVSAMVAAALSGEGSS